MGNNLVQQVTECLNSATIKAVEPGFNSADFQVQPRLVEVNYYGTKIKLSKYEPQNGVKPQFGVQDGQSISPEDFFVSRTEKRLPEKITHVVAVLGGAGYGKTEMLKKFARDVICKKINGLEYISVVYFISFRDLPVSGEITTGELLFGEMDLPPKQIRKYVIWIKNNSSRVMLVLDGADQYQDSNKLGKRTSFQSHERKASPVEIINAILSGKLFPGICILFSAREYAIRHFEVEVRPNLTVALIGLSLEDIEKVVLCHGAKRGQEIWHHLTTKAQCLLSVCSIPMFLDFTVKAFLDNDITPETLTEVLMSTLYNMVTSKHVECPKGIDYIIQELKEMAFNGTKDKRVTFTTQDLPRGINVDDVQAVLIPYPGRTGNNQTLIDGRFQFIFSHQSLQEALSSLHLNQMPLSEFKEFTENLHQPQWAMVRRFTCGIVFNETVRKIVDYVEIQDDIKRKENAAKKLKSSAPNVTCVTYIEKPVISANQFLCDGAKAEINCQNSNFAATATSTVHADDSERLTLPVKKCSSDKKSLKSEVARQRAIVLKESLTKELLRKAGHPDILELLHSLHECGEDDMKTIFPESMTDIVLGDIVPSPADVYVIGAIAEKCDQIRRVVLNTLNAAQLYGLAKAVKEQHFEVTCLRETTQIKNFDLLQLFRVFNKCGDNIAGVIKSSVKEISLDEVKLQKYNVYDLVFVLRRCSDLRGLSIWCSDAILFQTVAQEIIMANLKICYFDIGIWNGELDIENDGPHMRPHPIQRPLSEFVPTICNLMPHVTHLLSLNMVKHNDDGEILLSQIQEKLDSLPKTELKIEIKSFRGEKMPDFIQLGWKQRRCYDMNSKTRGAKN